jgi:hypothetical protein
MADQADRIRILDQPRGGRDDAGNADANGAPLARLALQVRDKAGDRRQRVGVAAGRRRDAETGDFAPFRTQRQPLYLGSP